MTLCNTFASGVVCALYIQICIVTNNAALQQAVTSSNSLLKDHKAVTGRYKSPSAAVLVIVYICKYGAHTTPDASALYNDLYTWRLTQYTEICIQGYMHKCTLYMVYTVVKLPCSVTCYARMHTTKQSTLTDLHSQLSFFALRPLGRHCANLGVHYNNTINARLAVSVFHMILGCQMSSQGIEPDLSSVISIILSNKTDQQFPMALTSASNLTI